MTKPNMPPWYHSFILRFPVQLLIFMVCIVFSMVQLLTFSIIEDYETVFQVQCEVTVGALDQEGNQDPGATMQCGQEQVDMGELESQYLFHDLKQNNNPVVMCEKKVGEFLGEERWSCEIKTESKT